MNQNHPPAPHVDHPWAKSWKKVCQALDVELETGLSPEDVSRREEQFGKNQLEKRGRENAGTILVRQFRSMIMAVLFGAVVLSYSFGRFMDGTAVFEWLLVAAASLCTLVVGQLSLRLSIVGRKSAG